MDRRSFIKRVSVATGIMLAPIAIFGRGKPKKWTSNGDYAPQPARTTYSLWPKSKLETFMPKMAFAPLPQIPMTFEEERAEFEKIVDQLYPK